MDCAGCGGCCDPVWLPYATPLELVAAKARLDAGARVSTAEGEANIRFIAEHMTYLLEQPATYLDGLPAATSGHTAWRCDRYDPVSKLCTAHDERPPICRGWPWYGEPPFAHSAMPAACSHNWDMPPAARGPLAGRLLPLWPVAAADDPARCPESPDGRHHRVRDGVLGDSCLWCMAALQD